MKRLPNNIKLEKILFKGDDDWKYPSKNGLVKFTIVIDGLADIYCELVANGDNDPFIKSAINVEKDKKWSSKTTIYFKHTKYDGSEIHKLILEIITNLYNEEMGIAEEEVDENFEEINEDDLNAQLKSFKKTQLDFSKIEEMLKERKLEIGDVVKGLSFEAFKKQEQIEKVIAKIEKDYPIEKEEDDFDFDSFEIKI